MRNIKLTLEYDGTHFSGWQWQPRRRSVQGEIERALESLLQEKVKLIGAGRTDAGVHALGQVANFHAKTSLDLNSIQNGLNSLLPGDIVILSAEEVDNNFHARYDAQKRKYRYIISTRPTAIRRFYSWYFKYDLNIDKIREASKFLLGENDFKSFCQAETEANHYRCYVESIEWLETEDEVILEIIANRFLHHMVRIIVGTMIDIGRGKLEVSEVEKILKARDRRAAGRTAPAKGLFLVEVRY